jgi:hypothetical protein
MCAGINAMKLFQPSTTEVVAATPWPRCLPVNCSSIQPSATSIGSCNYPPAPHEATGLYVSILQPPQSTAATTIPRSQVCIAAMFQSSAAVIGGCNLRDKDPYGPARPVSILSRRLRRLQPTACRCYLLVNSHARGLSTALCPHTTANPASLPPTGAVRRLAKRRSRPSPPPVPRRSHPASPPRGYRLRPPSPCNA